jgi:hypothetical protein
MTGGGEEIPVPNGADEVARWVDPGVLEGIGVVADLLGLFPRQSWPFTAGDGTRSW